MIKDHTNDLLLEKHSITISTLKLNRLQCQMASIKILQKRLFETLKNVDGCNCFLNSNLKYNGL